MMTTPKFDKTFCSQCGQEFGPGDHGFSHCSDHQGKIIGQSGPLSALQETAPSAGEPKRWHWTGNLCRFVNGRLVAQMEHSEYRSDLSPPVVLLSAYDALAADLARVRQELEDAKHDISRLMRNLTASDEACERAEQAREAAEKGILNGMAERFIAIADHIASNAEALHKFDWEGNEARCRELCSMYIRELATEIHMTKRLQALDAAGSQGK
jgi:hypothetical protein